VLGIANTESEHNIGRGIRSNGAHFSTYLVLGINGKHCIFLNETFKVHTIAIETNFNKWELRESWAFLLLGLSGIHPECDF
jgi:hypothetical protein